MASPVCFARAQLPGSRRNTEVRPTGTTSESLPDPPVFAKLPPIQQRYILLGGVVSSFLTMFFGATGNFIAAMVKSMNLDPVPHVATHSLMMTFQHFVKVLIFGLIGFQFGPYMFLIIGMLISGFIGTVIGSQFLTKAGGRYFKPVLNTILFLAAARLIWAGVEGFLAL